MGSAPAGRDCYGEGNMSGVVLMVDVGAVVPIAHIYESKGPYDG